MTTTSAQPPSSASAADATPAALPLLRPPGSPFGTTAIGLPYGSYVSIHHPDYSENCEIFSLPAYDTSDGVIGVHYGTVEAACQIIACNQTGSLWNEDNSLEPGTMSDAQYPICPSFDEWAFSAVAIPSEWRTTASAAPRPPASQAVRLYSESQMSQAVSARDGVCRITGYGESTQNAHLIPVTQLRWFIANNMRQYNRTRRNPRDPKHLIDDPRNGFLCRQDVNTTMDMGTFCVVCKEDRFVVHFLQETLHLGPLYHNREFVLSYDACVEFLWTRFAWSLFRMIGAFVVTTGRAIMLANVVLARTGDGQAEESQSRFQEEAVKLRPRSPGKRMRKEQGGAADDNGDISDGVDTATDAESVTNSDHSSYFSDDSLGDDNKDDSQLPLPPVHPTQKDIDKMHRFFLDMEGIGEVAWSPDYTWQTAPWYPGMEKMEELKRWWKRRKTSHT
ncbi:hypothetical protein K440DRAFT_608510 [Wilcoxina mikolae CBS 423.85]|nr:hypothetical protein K440DRAFT_608510 [Wilcoxina mikolae CBS 423.85]